jgi:hypothetical protein
MSATTKWPADFQNWIYVLRALRNLKKQGVKDSDAKHLIASVPAIWVSPRRLYDGKVAPREWSNTAEPIFQTGHVRRGVADAPQNFDAVRARGALCPVFVDGDALLGKQPPSQTSGTASPITTEDGLRQLAKEVAAKSKHVRSGIPVQKRLAEDIQKAWEIRPDAPHLTPRRYAEAARTERSRLKEVHAKKA